MRNQLDYQSIVQLYYITLLFINVKNNPGNIN